VTIARAFSDTCAGIAPAGVGPFIGAELGGMLAGVVVCRWLWKTGGEPPVFRRGEGTP
jgi:hypothetical protein